MLIKQSLVAAAILLLLIYVESNITQGETNSNFVCCVDYKRGDFDEITVDRSEAIK